MARIASSTSATSAETPNAVEPAETDHIPEDLGADVEYIVFDDVLAQNVAGRVGITPAAGRAPADGPAIQGEVSTKWALGGKQRLSQPFP